MRHLLLTLGLVVALADAGQALNLPSNLGLSPSDVRAIERGEVVAHLRETSESTLKDVLCVAVIKADPERIWTALTNYGKYGKMFQGILKGETRRKEGNITEQYTLFDYPWPFEDRWTVNRLIHAEDHRSITWRRIDGTVKEIVGSWQLIPQGDETLVIYKVRLDPGIALIPSWALDWGGKQVAPGILKGLKREVETP